MSMTISGGNAMVPASMDQAVRLAEMMAKSKTLPAHFHNSPGDTLMVVEQAMRWNMSPFAVAQCTSVVKGKLMFEGKLVAAAVQHSGAIDGHFDYQFSGTGLDRKVKVIARRRGEAEPRDIELALKDARTENGMWVKQPDQQLVYAGTRVWARRWTPGVLLGVYAPEEFDAPERVADTFAGPTIEADAVVVQPETPQPIKRTAKQFLAELERELSACRDADAVDLVIASEDVQRAIDTFTNGLRTELIRILDEARVRFPVDAAAPF